MFLAQWVKQIVRGARAIAVGGNVTASTLVTGDHNTIHVYHSQRPRPAVATLFQAPLLPPYFVARPEVMEQLKEHVLSKVALASPGVLVISALQGQGGIGKSTLAAALAHEPDVAERFPDGVLWATLGQEPDLLSLLSRWIQALGDYG